MSHPVSEYCVKSFPVLWERIRALDTNWVLHQQKASPGWLSYGSTAVGRKAYLCWAVTLSVIHSSTLALGAIILNSPPIRFGVASENMRGAAAEAGTLWWNSSKVTMRLTGAFLGVSFPGKALDQSPQMKKHNSTIRELKKRLAVLQGQYSWWRSKLANGSTPIPQATLRHLNRKMARLQRESNALIIDYIYGQKSWWELYALWTLKRPLEMEICQLEERDMTMGPWIMKRLFSF